ncbi:hypothetical protein DL771_003421 [Monosporascus sp. 5C6A]|nr:hypothetical protein DL771_003421 [Monosporascus sp. 5C6A]
MPPPSRPATTGYERLAQADQFSDESDDDTTNPLSHSYASLQPQTAPRFAPIAQPRPHSGMTSPTKASRQRRQQQQQQNRYRPKRGRSNSGVDLKAINARLERWADEIASKFKRKGKGRPGEEEERLEIVYSVFQPPDGVRPATAEALAALPEPAMSKDEFDEIVQSVRTAIDQGMHPSMITQGSSGSYFARNTDGKIVGVFKPKDEEPYAAGNPKWNKWIHRNLFPCFFGRAWRAFYRKKKPLPAKPGSFQVFLKGFKDANVFLREHPWPEQYWSGFRSNDTHRNRRKRWADSCRPSSRRAASDHSESEDEHDSAEERPLGPDNFVWTESLKQSFREELEKLVILDYIMRNTDRGLDNWMIKVDWETQEVSIASEPPQLNMDIGGGNDDEEDDGQPARPVDPSWTKSARSTQPNPYRAQKPMDANGSVRARDPKISIGAIDNSLSWPWKHPDAWRSFPFGWLFLPVDLIGRPFSQKTRDHFLPLLTSSQWWSETQYALRKDFQIDPDFQEKMFSRQMAVMKGQAWNVVETLKIHDHGPLELTRRPRVCVWDDLVDVPVAVPMRVASSELRRKAEPDLRETAEEEMDIGAVNSSSAAAKSQGEDLLGLASPLPHPGRFELTTSPRSQSPEGANSISRSVPNGKAHEPLESPASHSEARPSVGNAPTASYQGASRPQLSVYHPRRERRFSFASARQNGHSIAQRLHGYAEDDDMEGDLGYAAAEGMEGNRRKVIVERLETVKSRNPVFSWC